MVSRSISHTASFEVRQAADVVFPLFSPEGEKKWVPGWDYENIMGTLQLGEDYVFLTTGHDHAAVEAVWIVKSYDRRGRRVQYYKVEPSQKVGIVSVGCEALDRHLCRVTVSYTYIGLSDSGNRFIANFTRAAYEKFIGEWKTLLEAYFAAKTGRSQ